MSKSSLPIGWTASTIGDLVVPRIEQGAPVDGVEFMYVDIGSIDTKTKRIVSPKRLPIIEAPSRARQRMQVGDVVVSMTRPNLNAVAILPSELEGSVGSTGFCVLRAKAVDPHWLFYRVRASDFVDAMSFLVQGALYPAVRAKDVFGFPVSVPPLYEQKQIVAEIETQFARLDSAVSALKSARIRLKRYRASVLKAACEGRLVPRQFPNNWSCHLLGQHIERIEAGKNFRCVERPPEAGEVGVVKVSAVSWGEFRERESKTCTDASLIRSELMIHPNDFLISRANTLELVGACVIVRDVSLSLMLSDKVLRLTFGPSLNPKWAMYFLRSDSGRHEIESRSTGNQLSMRNIGQDRIRSIPLPVPPLDQQERIVAEIESRMSVIEQMEALVEMNLKRAETLRQSILRMAFSRQLNPCGASE